MGFEDLKIKGFPDIEIISMGQWQSIFQLYGPKGTNSKLLSSTYFSENDSVSDERTNITDNKNDIIVLSDNENIEINENIVMNGKIKNGIHGSEITFTIIPEDSSNHPLRKMKMEEEGQGTERERGGKEGEGEVELVEDAFEIKLILNTGSNEDTGEGDTNIMKQYVQSDHKNNSENNLEDNLENNSEKKCIQNSKRGSWTCIPSYCKACQEGIEQRIDDIHSNFQNIFFDVTILQPTNILDITTDNVITMDDSTKDGDSLSQYNRRNPTRIRSSRRGLKIVKVSLSSTDLISNVKIKLAEKVDEDTFQGLAGHVLMYAGVAMTDNQLSLRDYKVKSGETLCLQVVRNTSANGDGDVFALLSSLTNKSGYFSEKGFQGSFLSGTGMLAVSTANAPSSSSSAAHIDDSVDIQDFVIHVDTIDPRTMEISMKQIMEFTGCTFDVARKMLIKCEYNVNEACAIISDEM